MGPAVGFAVASLLAANPGTLGAATDISLASPRTGAVELKLGSYLPSIDEEEGVGSPYADTFDGSMLLFEVEIERFFYQGIGTAGVGLSVGYAEKYGNAKETGSGNVAAEITALKVLPVRLSALYKFDYAAFRYGIPLVPYVEAGLVYIPWWINKGTEYETVAGSTGKGGRYGYGFTAGISFMLDVLEPRFARDFDSDSGVNHSYLFAEYTRATVDNFGGAGLNLSSRNWMFGLAFDY